jgi:hypothetical protein
MAFLMSPQYSNFLQLICKSGAKFLKNMVEAPVKNEMCALAYVEYMRKFFFLFLGKLPSKDTLVQSGIHLVHKDCDRIMFHKRIKLSPHPSGLSTVVKMYFQHPLGIECCILIPRSSFRRHIRAIYAPVDMLYRKLPTVRELPQSQSTSARKTAR